jgi:RNA polymerase sigma-70 factor (ECF subfamily)
LYLAQHGVSPHPAMMVAELVAVLNVIAARVDRDGRRGIAKSLRTGCQVSVSGGITQLMRLVAPDPGPAFDPDLIPRLRRGDPSALTAIYRAFGGELLALARRLTGSNADAEDVLHDLIVGLPDALRNYEERGRLRAWLKQIVARMCLMRLRTARRRRETDLDTAGQIPVRAASAADFDDAIEIALRDLPRPIRAVVVLRFIEGLSHREIAETLGISITASEMRLSRGIVALRRRLETLI